MKILLVTSAARGHAIADALSRSTHNPEIISVCSTANPGIRTLASTQHVGDIMDFDWILSLAKEVQPDFAVIGPEDPICSGLSDRLEDAGVPTVAPKKSLAQVESSKGFTRDLLSSHGIDASPKFKVFTSMKGSNMNNFIDQELGGNFVVKYDSLKGGKGVKVSQEHLHSTEEGVGYAKCCIKECGRVVIEEKLIGSEFSLISFVSGTQVIDTPAIQDHKRAHADDTGPNTGGMGTYSDADHSLPFLTLKDIERASEINRLTAAALLDECGQPYTGILYGGFIATKDGVKVIEYNCRFGDPEGLNILPLLTTDFVDICLAMIEGTLSDDLVQFENKATVCKYITPDCYPESKESRGKTVGFPDAPDNAHIYYGDISEQEDGTLTLGGSRTAGIVGIADTLEQAEQIAEDLCQKVEGPVRFRSDIGKKELIQKRIDLMAQLRS